MNVLHLIHGRIVTGPVAAALNDVRALSAAGHAAWLGGRSGSYPEQGAQAAGVAFAGGFRLGRGAARLLHLPADGARLRALVDDLKLDAVHVHRSDDQLLAQLALRRMRHVKLVRTWHRSPSRVPSPLLRELAQGCHALVCTNRADAATLAAGGAREARYLPSAVDTDAYRPRHERPPGPPKLGLIGRWKAGEDRGQRAFLNVLEKLERSLPWQGVLLGRGEDRAELERLIARHPARERIVLEETDTGYARQAAALRAGLVFATGSDGSSRPAAELLACGVPLLLADRPGLREFGEDAACARVLPAEDAAAWAEALYQWLRDPERLAQRGHAARERAERVHALPVRGAALAELYARI
ncbi:MAG: glycosyltransferase [Planctomycetes bacterium]|nr:glycosyltransferase [Planctomycetota bacterium]